MINATTVSLLEQYRNYSPLQFNYSKDNNFQEETKITSYTDRYRPTTSTSDKRIEQLEKDREYLLKKNIEFEKNLTRLEKVINNVSSLYNKTHIHPQHNQTHSNNIHVDLIKEPSYLNKKIHTSKHNINVNPKPKVKHPSTIEKRNVSSSLSNISTMMTKSVPLKKTSTTAKTLSNKKNGRYISLKEKETIENKELKEQIVQTQKKIMELQEELYYATLAKKGNNFLIMELTSWKKKTESLGKEMFDELNDLKQTLFNDKKSFCDDVLRIKKECNVYLSTMKEKFQTTIEKQELLIEMFTEQNNKVKKRLHKIRSIFY